jgi:hypothetical protein
LETEILLMGIDGFLIIYSLRLIYIDSFAPPIRGKSGLAANSLTSKSACEFLGAIKHPTCQFQRVKQMQTDVGMERKAHEEKAGLAAVASKLVVPPVNGTLPFVDSTSTNLPSRFYKVEEQ